MKAKPKASKGKISKSISLADVIMEHPEVVSVFQKHGLHCIGCAVAAYESVEQGALAHGIDPDTLVKDINQALKKTAKAAKKE